MSSNHTGLHEIYQPASGSAVADVVFVHGLGGASHDTWRHGKDGDADHFFWPAVLGEELGECNVWTVGYEADISRASGKGMIIGLRALSVASLLISQEVGLFRPVIFVCHSMGGLIVKALVDGCRQNTNPAYETLAGNIQGIVFCGTPHRGSNFAVAAMLIGKVLGGSTAWTNEMCSDETGIELLHERFLGWLQHNPISILTVVEHSISFGSRWMRVEVGIVVPRASAVLSNEPVEQHDVADHFQLVKPSGFTDITYACTKKFIDALVAPYSGAGSSHPVSHHV